MNDEISTKPENDVEDDPQHNPGQDVVNRYFSVRVMPPSSGLGGTDDDTKHDTYFRMGMPDDAIEGRLPPDPNHPETPGTKNKSPWKDGLVLYTDGQYKLVAPSLSTTAADSLAISARGTALTSATYTTTFPTNPDLGAAMIGGTTVTVARQNQLTASLGTSLGATIGIGQTFWNGIRTTAGLGSNLTSNVGSNATLSTSQTVALTLDGLELKGAGMTNVVGRNDVFSAGPIRLSSSSSHKTLLDTSSGMWRSKVALAVSVVAAAAPILLALGTTIPTISVWGANQDEDQLKTALIASHIELGVLMGVFTVIQAAIAIGAGITRTAGVPATVGADLVNPTAAILKLDDGAPTYLIKGERKLVFDRLNNIILTNGGLSNSIAPTIRMSATDIVLSAGGSNITINSSGVTINGTTAVKCAAGGATLDLAAAGASLAGTQVRVGIVDPAALAATQAAQVAATAQLALDLATANAERAAEIFDLTVDMCIAQLEIAAASV
jgi:hypothetical protein